MKRRRRVSPGRNLLKRTSKPVRPDLETVTASHTSFLFATQLSTLGSLFFYDFDSLFKVEQLKPTLNIILTSLCRSLNRL